MEQPAVPSDVMPSAAADVPGVPAVPEAAHDQVPELATEGQGQGQGASADAHNDSDEALGSGHDFSCSDLSDQEGPRGSAALDALIAACAEGSVDVVQSLLATDARAHQGRVYRLHNTPNEDGQCALHAACDAGQDAIVKLLLTLEDTSIDQPDDDGCTSLCVACSKADGKPQGHASTVRILLAARANPNHANNEGATALLVAARNGYRDIVAALVGAEGTDCNHQDESGNTALIDSAQYGHVDVVNTLVAAPGLDVNLGSKFGTTALYMAAAFGHTSVTRALVAAPGIDVNKGNDEGDAPIYIASLHGHVDVVQTLVSAKGINVNLADDEGDTALIVASRNVHVDIVSVLVGVDGVAVNATNNDGDTALFLASENGHVEVVRILLQIQGIDVNTRNALGITPLMIASEGMHVGVVRLLVGVSSIDINQQNHQGFTALHFSSKRRQFSNESGTTRCRADVVKVLVRQQYIDVNIACRIGWTAMYAAAQAGYVEVVQILASLPNIDVNRANKMFGWTPLIVASEGKEESHMTIVKLLIATRNIDINQEAKDGQTALHVACRVGNAEMTTILLVGGACRLKTDGDGELPVALAHNNGHEDTKKLFDTGIEFWWIKRHRGHCVGMRRLVYVALLLQNYTHSRKHRDSRARKHWLPKEMWLLICSFIRSADYAVAAPENDGTDSSW